jgi:rhamnosyltransferase
MKSYGLIFVLYHPTEAFLRNLDRAAAAGQNLIAVDNSPQPDLALYELLRRKGMTVLHNANRGGLAGAYNLGAEILLERGCEVIFLLDQDSDIGENFFGAMMQACERMEREDFILGPKIYEINLEKFMVVLPPGRRWPKPVKMREPAEGLFETLFVISSGSAISAAAYRRLGAFREDYFIEYIDVEYGLRANSRGVPVYMNAAVTMRQTTGEIERHGRLFTTNHAAWRRYYGARNGVFTLRLYRAHWALHWLGGLLALHQSLNVLLFEPQKLRKVLAVACGYLDGRRGRLGTFESLHPRIAAFCKKLPARPGPLAGGSTVAAEERP